jgi:hypothetical protein
VTWLFFVIGAALCWGSYGPLLHIGQGVLGGPWKALLCVGLAYFLIGVVVPASALGAQGQLNGFHGRGLRSGLAAGGLGVLGAICIISAFNYGGSAIYVMPLVYAGAPVVNALLSMALHPPKRSPSPLLYVGMLLAAGGASMVLYFKPQS